MNFGRMLLLTNNNKKSTQKLRQVFASIILSASCIIPVVAGNEKTHVDKSKKSTSSWLRTGLELLLGAGCVGGVIREFQNRNTINSKDKTISDLNQMIIEASKGLTADQQEELKPLKDLIDKVYNEQEYKKYLTITDKNVEYKVNNILQLQEAKKLGLKVPNFKPTNESGIIKTLKPGIPDKRFEYDNVHTVPSYNLCLLTLADIELISKNNLVNKEAQTKVKMLTNKNEQRAQFIKQHVSLKSVVLQHIAIFVNTMFNNKFSESFHKKLQSCRAEHTINDLTAPPKINIYWKNCDLNTQQSLTKVKKLYLWEAILYIGFKEIVENTDKKFPSNEITGDFKDKFTGRNLTLHLLYNQLTPDYVSNTKIEDASELKLALLALKFVDELATNLSMVYIRNAIFSCDYWNMPPFTNLGLHEMWEKYKTNVQEYEFEYNLFVEKA